MKELSVLQDNHFPGTEGVHCRSVVVTIHRGNAHGLPSKDSGTVGGHQDRALSTENLNQGFEAYWLRLGMTAEAIAGWRNLNAQPFAICSAYFSAALLMQVVSAYMLAGKTPITAWHAIGPHCTLAAVWVVYVLRMWRLGPRSAKTSLNGILTLPHILAAMFIGVSICVGPESWLPYRKRPLSVILLSLFVLACNTAGNCGAVPTLHPAVPHPSMQEPLIQASLDTVRVMDVLTEGFTIRMLLEQVLSTSVNHRQLTLLCRSVPVISRLHSFTVP